MSTSTGVQMNDSPGLRFRSACERCRSQKLRCERSSDGSRSDCRRCLRKGVTCTTDVSLKAGRPSANSIRDARRERWLCEQLAQAGQTTPESLDMDESLPWLEEAAPSPTTASTQFMRLDEGISRCDKSREVLLLSTELSQNDVVAPWQAMDGLFDFSMGSSTASPQSLPSSGPSDSPLTPNFLSGREQTTKHAGQHDFRYVDARSSQSLEGGVYMSSIGAPYTPKSDKASGILSYENDIHSKLDYDYQHTDKLRTSMIQTLCDLTGRILQDLAEPCDDRLSEPIVRQMLEYSEEFLEIFSCVSEVTLDTASSSSSSTMLRERTTQRTADLGLTMSCDPVLIDVHETRIMSDETSKFGPFVAVRPNVSTALAIMTCYTTLCQLYGHVFSALEQTWSTYPSIRDKLEPHSLPSVRLCGFTLDHYGDLQLEIVTRISLHMLNRIEQKLEEIAKSCAASHFTEEALAANVFGLVVAQSFDVGLGPAGGAQSSLKRITTKLRKMLGASQSC